MRAISTALAVGLATLLAACDATPMPTPTVTPSPTETGIDPTFTESPTPLPDGEVPDDLGDRTLVSVVITFVTWSPTTSEVLVAGFVPDVVESGGTCQARAVSGTTLLEASQEAEPDASSTSCGQLALKGDALTSGTWTITMWYSSTTSAGSSAARSLEIP